MIGKLKDKLAERMYVNGAYMRLFETEDGKIVLKHLMKEGFVMSSTFVAGDSHKTALNEGSRRIVLSIIRQANKTPQEILTEVEDALT